MEMDEVLKDSIDTLFKKDEAMTHAVCELINYLASTYNEKYANSELRNEGIIYSPNLGKGFNCGNAAKYLSRYITTGFAKSENPEDLIKIIHYSLFEYVRKKHKPNFLKSSEQPLVKPEPPKSKYIVEGETPKSI